MGKKTREYPFRFKSFTALTKSLVSKFDTATLELIAEGQITIKITRLRNAGQSHILKFRGTVQAGKEVVTVKGICDLTQKTGHIMLSEKLAAQIVEAPEPLLKEE